MTDADRIRVLLTALSDLREAAADAYKAGRISAEPFVRAGNVLSDVTEDLKEGRG
jgi:hypothetical protein